MCIPQKRLWSSTMSWKQLSWASLETRCSVKEKNARKCKPIATNCNSFHVDTKQSCGSCFEGFGLMECPVFKWLFFAAFEWRTWERTRMCALWRMTSSKSANSFTPVKSWKLSNSCFTFRAAKMSNLEREVSTYQALKPTFVCTWGVYYSTIISWVN